MKQSFVYMMTNKKKGTIYTGVTGNLPSRVWQHKNNVIEGFTKQYKLHQLVYFEQCEDIRTAIQREKRIKKWKRAWKVELIEKLNPDWKDLYEEIVL